MKLAVFADEKTAKEIEALIKNEMFSKRLDEVYFHKDYDGLISALSTSCCDGVMIAYPGAEGMESARAAKILCPKCPLIWFSNDQGFGPESFRIGCTYFSLFPITEKELKIALDRCDSERRLPQ